MLSERVERLETALTSDKHNLNVQLCLGQRAQRLCAVNSHQCQKALARCSLDVDKQLLTVIDYSENPLPTAEWQKTGGAAFSVFGCFLCDPERTLSCASYPGNRSWSVVQDGTGLAVDQAQFDKPTHGLGEALWDRVTVNTFTWTPGTEIAFFSTHGINQLSSRKKWLNQSDTL